MKEDDHNNEIKLIKRILQDENYSDFQFFKEGGTRRLYLAKWGPADELRVIKIDKEPTSQRVKGYVERGYNTSNDILSLAHLKDPEKHNLIRFCDFKTRDERTVSVESYFESKSLEELLQERQLSVPEVEKIFSKVIEGVSYQHEMGLFHRDIKPSNILVDENLEVRITDFANACKKDNLKAKFNPTADGHWVMDPLLITGFTGEKRAYNEQSEIYALATDLLFALTGKYVFEYDPDTKTGKDCANRENLLSPSKTLTFRHDEVLEEALKTLPKTARKYKSLFRKALTIDESKRYSSLDDFEKDFKKASRPSFWRRPMLSAHPAVYVAAAVLCIASGIGVTLEVNGHKDKIRQLETEAEQSVKYEVVSGWDGDTLEVTCNLLDLDFKVVNSDPYELLYGGKWFGREKRPQFLTLKSGQKLRIMSLPKEKPRPKKGASLPAIKGKVYFEGWSGKEFHTDSMIVDCSQYEMYGPMLQDVDITVPKDMKDGNYTLIMELYAHDRPDPPNHISALKDIKYANPGKLLCRKRLPVVVGKPKDEFNIGTLRLGISEYLSIRSLGEDFQRLNNSLSYEISIPEIGFRKRYDNEGGPSNAFSVFNTLPSPKDTREVTLQIAVLDRNNLVGYFAAPIQGDHICKNTLWWKFALNGPEFAERLVPYRQDLQKRLDEMDKTTDVSSHNQPR